MMFCPKLLKIGVKISTSTMNLFLPRSSMEDLGVSLLWTLCNSVLTLGNSVVNKTKKSYL
jgi:hypothetical protein